jgi:hypothetical protein
LEVEVSDEEMRQTAQKIIERDMIKKRRTEEDKKAIKLRVIIKMLKNSA